MRYILLVIFLFLFATDIYAQAPQWQWAQIGNDAETGFGNDIVVDAANNVYVTGTFTDTLYIGNDTLISAGNSDIFVAKYNSSGQLLWVKRAGGSGADNGISIAIDQAGNVYVASTYADIAAYDTTVLVGKGFSDLALVKYDSSGNMIWIKTWGSIYGDSWGKMCIRGGNVYLTGEFANYGGSPSVYETINFDQLILTSHGDEDVFVVKMDTSGKIKWAKNGGGKFSDLAEDICSDTLGNVYVTGGFTASSTVYFDNVHLTAKIGPYQDMFIVKYDSSGNVLWGKGAGGNYPTYGSSLINDNKGNVYVVGGSASSPFIDFGSVTLSLNNDISFLAKYDAQGDLLWVKNISSYSFDDGVGNILFDSSNNIYLSGSFNYLAVYGNDTLYSFGHDDISVIKLDSNGNHIWATHAGGVTNDGAYGIALDHAGNILVTGYTSSSPSYFGSNQISAYGQWDMFVAKLSGTTGIPIIAASQSDLELYPNPSSGILHFKANKENFTSLKVFDQLGRVVAEQSLKPNQSSIDVHQLADGIYYLQLKGKGLPVTKKIIIQH